MLHGYNPHHRYLPYLSWTEIADLPDKENTVIVLPTGATEQHGPHLPCAVDTVISTGVVGHALARLPASVAAIGTMAVPVIGVVASAVALGEPLGAAQIAGLIFTLAAVALATR